MKVKKVIKLLTILTLVPFTTEIRCGFGSGFGGGLVGGMFGSALIAGPRTREVYVNSSDGGYYQSKAADLENQLQRLRKELKSLSKTNARYLKYLKKYIKLINKYMKQLAEKGVKVTNEIKNDTIDFDDDNDDSAVESQENTAT